MRFQIVKITVLCLLIITNNNICFADNEPGIKYDLPRCYQLALLRSYTLKDNLSMIEQARARISQAKASFLPTLDYNYSYFKQEKPSSISGFLTGGSLPSHLTEQTTEKLTADQTIFNGFKDFANLKQKQSEAKAYAWALEQAKLQLYDDVASSYFNVLEYEADEMNYNQEKETYMQRLQEIDHLIKKGRARRSDYLSVESLLATLEANRANNKGLLNAQREAFSFLTGLSDDIVLDNPLPHPFEDKDLNYWLSFSDNRPLIKEAQENLKAAEKQVLSARSGYLPQADIEGNYYVKRQDGYNGVDWDMMLKVKVPIFNGGDTYSQVREYRGLLAQKENYLQELKDESIRDIRSAYKTVLANEENQKKLGLAVSKSQEYCESLRKDNAMGLAPHLDVLIAISNFYETKRLYDRAVIATQYSIAKLKSLTSDSINQLE
ncbi:MAG: TolC family protein [Candidatus Omnitrophica bacterium]|nr:TolC family protein [Candidatus Omnitrophota bacterium]